MSNQIDAYELKRLLAYDPETGVFRHARHTTQSVMGSIAGRKMSCGYIRITLKDRDYLAHRLAWLYMTGEWPAAQVDHKDCVKDNNRWENLRAASGEEQARNRRLTKANKSGLKGVSKYRDRNIWRAQITVSRRVIWLGDFRNKEDAHAAYVEAAAQEHGGFARTA